MPYPVITNKSKMFGNILLNVKFGMYLVLLLIETNNL